MCLTRSVRQRANQRKLIEVSVSEMQINHEIERSPRLHFDGICRRLHFVTEGFRGAESSREWTNLRSARRHPFFAACLRRPVIFDDA